MIGSRYARSSSSKRTSSPMMSCPRRPGIVVLALVLAAAPAVARIGPSWPAAIEEAPVERAIANVTADRELTEPQRERLLGRLHLIGYAQRRAQVQRYA